MESGQLFFRSHSDFGFACDSPMSRYLCEFIQCAPRLLIHRPAASLFFKLWMPEWFGFIDPRAAISLVKSEAIHRTCLGRSVGSFQVSVVAQVAT